MGRSSQRVTDRVVEGIHYFPPQDVRPEDLERSSHRTVCPWKGTASCHDAVVNGERAEAAAWYYPDPASAAIKDHVAFCHGVNVRRAPAH
jgi:uncharacterized protein (DUF427 family)